ncbi:hypothetical protein [Streptomyces sp. NPDC059783]|uniref:hypothetical protein n=1 Tax=Streptomyces sp. NPDC059783 TaxID=3346944 RepID=UPI00364DCDFA
MSTDQDLRAATARWARRRRRLIGYNQWQPFVDATPVRNHVQAIRATGMSVKNLSAVTGVSISTLDHLLYGSGKFPPAARIRPDSARTLMAFWPVLDDYVDGATIDATGTRRRLQALASIGWPVTSIHRSIGFGNVKTIEHGRHATQVTARLARAVRTLYTSVAGRPAEENGITPWVAARCRRQASSFKWVGPEAWDDDTIDDPATQAEITGCCGTDRGWWMHTLQKLPMCEPCETAHLRWKADHQGLSRNEYMSALATARAASTSRGPDIAHDGRELMRLGCDYDQAAARLGVSKQHLQQELNRHPEPEPTKDAA